jgi:ABC-type Mn2+/Zn2+ transport system ATPase subunit
MAEKQNGAPGNALQVMFGSRRVASTPVPENHILIVPSEDRWNDFGYRTKVDIYVNVNEVLWNGPAYIGFLTNSPEEPDDVDRVNEWLASASELTIAATESTRFFTMLPHMKSYREIVLTYGLTLAVRILRAMRDLVVLRELPSNANWLDLATRSQVFLKSFMRTSESFFAYHNAGAILRGLEHEESGNLSKSLGITFRLTGRESDHEIQFHFDHQGALPKRIAVIIGKNGVGKSQTLGRIATAALTGDPSLIDIDTQGRPLLNRLLAFAPTNEAKSVFPTDRRRRPSIWYKRFSLNRSERLTLANGVAGSIVQVARSQEYIRNISRWDIFLKAIEAIHRSDEIRLPSIHGSYLTLRDLQSGGERTSLENYGFVDERRDPVRVIDGQGYPLSSGEISFLRFAAQASLHIENGSLLLLDEPETHLHPNFISQLVLLLDNLLQQTGSAAIIATHSVYFVREVFPAQVTVLRIGEEGTVLAEQPRLRTFGADVGAISYFVFGEDEPSCLAARVEKRLLSRFNSWDELYSQYKDELSLEVLGALREAMEAKASK